MPRLRVLLFGALVPRLRTIGVRSEGGAVPRVRSYLDLVEESLAYLPCGEPGHPTAFGPAVLSG